MPTVQVRFAPPLHERLIQECERLEVTPSEFIRKLADAALNQMDTPKQSPADDPQMAEMPIDWRELGHHGPKDRDRPTKGAPVGYSVDVKSGIGGVKDALAQSRELQRLAKASSKRASPVRGYAALGGDPVVTKTDRLKGK